MISSDGMVLEGLPGDNPLGFLAGLGAQTALAEAGKDHCLHWTNDPIPRAVISPECGLIDIAGAVRALADRWLAGPALDKLIHQGLKLKPSAIRDYLDRGRADSTSGRLSFCLLAEDSLNNAGNAKPTDLYFTSGQQRFIKMTREILADTTVEEIMHDVSSPWRYASERPSLMWDSVDDRAYALRATNPSDSEKLTNPGAEALAIIGLSCYPCFWSPHRTQTQGCSGKWNDRRFVWPLWIVPASRRSVKALLAQVDNPGVEGAEARETWYPSWGLSQVMESQIRRGSKGYGTFGPPRVVWQRD